jgi:hypothetical protein
MANYVRAPERPEVRRLTQTPLELFQKFQRFIVASALEVMGESRIDWARQCLLQFVDLFRNGTEPRHMRSCIATTFSILNDLEAFSQSLGEITNGVFH